MNSVSLLIVCPNVGRVSDDTEKLALRFEKNLLIIAYSHVLSRSALGSTLRLGGRKYLSIPEKKKTRLQLIGMVKCTRS